MRQTDYQHNTPEQARGYVEAALALVDELSPPDDLRVAVFTKACDLFAAKQVVLEHAAVAPQGLGALLRQ